MMNKKLILTILVLSLVVITGCANIGPSISVNFQKNDFGEINPANGKVSKILQLTNEGKSELVIDAISTSCGCTTAVADKLNLMPGESTNLNITYDPWVHEGFTGEIVRVVYVQSNDPNNKEIEIDFAGTVLDNYPEDYNGDKE